MTGIFKSEKIDYLKGIVYVLPELPGIYQYFDNTGQIIYVGKAKNLKKRVSSYFTKSPENRKTAMLIRNISDIRHMVVDTEEDALLLENNLIKKYQPRYNIRLKDDKTYPWICIKKERFPRVFKTRKIIHDGSEYFGPFSSWLAVSTLLEMFRRIYRLRICNYLLTKENIERKKLRICLEYHIGNCDGPCQGLIDEAAYARYISEIRDILKGNISGVIRQLRKLMEDFSSEYKFEEAQILKEKISSLEKYRSKSTVVNSKITDVDVFSIDLTEKLAVVNYLKIKNGAIVQTYSMEIKKMLDESKNELFMYAVAEIRQKIYSNSKEIIVPFKPDINLKGVKFTVPRKGDKFKLLELSEKNAKYFRIERERQNENVHPIMIHERILETLKRDLHLKEIPRRIECFDNSNIQGENAVAACVVFINGAAAKREYRHYNVKTVVGANDFASMSEIVSRRYSRQIEEGQPLPQLVIVDGGKGQLSFATEAIEKLGLRGKIGLIGIAKNLEEIYFPGDNIPIYLDKRSESLKIIQHIRDEAHRFGISFHRLKRSKDLIKTELEQIEGIGPATIKKLLLKYKSVKNVSSLALNQLQDEIGESKARLIYNYFKNQKKEE
jgi:excinuclease ABC subunit C